ncbi:hypothetical protein PT287_07695 [Lactobacillus sp. ESL0679]|uniref:hypothetical protein n=1 Tax=Lactobacillus sp. ESL0679 TaxID=2983209 RepID=UPI0023F76E6E|nr:hypothetical protein [Lactobacillus sp. ESL0679]MDF7683383.1 hypothetical protein [Lactobacillus sp. ESL0679]
MSSMCEIPEWVYENNPSYWAKQAMQDGGIIVCNDESEPKFMLSGFQLGKKVEIVNA